MKDLVLSARRGVVSFLDAPVAIVLFGSGLLWTVANAVLGWVLLGPAFVVLFRISLKALRGEEIHFKEDNLAVVEDLPAALVLGILFALPFKLWAMLDDTSDVVARLVDIAGQPAAGAVLPGIPLTASAAIFVHFAFLIFAFPILADRHCGVIDAVRRSFEIADQPGRNGSRLHGLGRHLIFTSATLLLILVAARAWHINTGAGGISTAVIGPVAVAVLAAWYLQATGSPAEETGPAPADDDDN